MKALSRLALAALLAWPLAGCQSRRETAEQEEDMEQYELVTRTGSILPRKVKKGKKPSDDPAYREESAAYLERMQREQMRRSLSSRTSLQP